MASIYKRLLMERLLKSIEASDMKFTKTKLDGVVIIEPDVFGDHRGFFMESWSKKKMEEAGLYYNFVQDNHSMSSVKGTLRGIHFQKGDKAQAKLVRCVKGAVLDVAVDLRHDSPTYKQWIAVELNEENKKQLLIPRGFGHGSYGHQRGSGSVRRHSDDRRHWFGPGHRGLL